jgi:hypothetical protein
MDLFDELKRLISRLNAEQIECAYLKGLLDAD